MRIFETEDSIFVVNQFSVCLIARICS